MVGIVFSGRLGNNLFQFAFGVAESKRLGTGFFVSRPQALKYFDLDVGFYLKNAYYKLKSIKIYWTGNLHLVNWEDPCGAPDAYLLQCRNDTLYKGCFQAEAYFREHREQVLAYLRIKSKYKALFDHKYGKVLANGKKIGVFHFRRTDYHQFRDSPVLPFSYYEECLSRIEGREDYTFYGIGDDIEEVKRHYSPSCPVCFETNCEIVDMQLLMHADVLIMSNSTFAWWGGYLNGKPGKTIYAPKNWLGFKSKEEFPEGIMVPEWNWIDVV